MTYHKDKSEKLVKCQSKILVNYLVKIQIYFVSTHSRYNQKAERRDGMWVSRRWSNGQLSPWGRKIFFSDPPSKSSLKPLIHFFCPLQTGYWFGWFSKVHGHLSGNRNSQRIGQTIVPFVCEKVTYIFKSNQIHSKYTIQR